MADIWPIDWPTTVDITQYDEYHVARAEEAAAKSLRFLTLYRVGGLPITVMPCTARCCKPFTGGQIGNSYVPFYPILLDSGRYTNCWCTSGCNCEGSHVVNLRAPASRIDEVQIDGLIIPPTAYRVEDGYRLVRIDGGTWPSCKGDKFTVTYLNSFEVDVYGQFIGGLLAYEFLLLLTAPSECRLPKGLESVTRQGMSYRLVQGLFPDGMTNVPEVDLYIKQWNPFALKTLPQVYSPDMDDQHQITWEV